MHVTKLDTHSREPATGQAEWVAAGQGSSHQGRSRLQWLCSPVWPGPGSARSWNHGAFLGTRGVRGTGRQEENSVADSPGQQANLKGKHARPQRASRQHQGRAALAHSVKEVPSRPFTSDMGYRHTELVTMKVSRLLLMANSAPWSKGPWERAG